MSNFIINPYRFAADNFHPDAVDFDGSTEYMAYGTAIDLGIVDDFSVGTWIVSNDVTATQAPILLDVSTANSTNWVYIFIVGSGFQCSIYDNSGSSNKTWKGNTTLVNGTKYFLSFSFDGSGNALNMYVNGVLESTPTKLTDDSFTLSAGNRRVNIGGRYNDGAFKMNGKINSCALWSAVLDADNMLALYNSGTGYLKDYQSDFGNYNNSSNLVGYWPLGQDTADIGKELITGTADVDTNAANITSDDVVTF